MEISEGYCYDLCNIATDDILINNDKITDWEKAQEKCEETLMWLNRRVEDRIEAMKLQKCAASIYEVIQFISDEPMSRNLEKEKYDEVFSQGGIIIHTLEGDMKASFGDYIIIKGVNGEFYPCKPDIFEKTYEVVK